MKPEVITQPELKKILKYNPDTGIFKWKVIKSNNIKIGDIAGCFQNKTYVRIKIDGKHYQAHRLAWCYMCGTFPKQQIDHINHNTLDNRIANLREVTFEVNHKNCKKYKTNSSGYTGVNWNKQSQNWRAKICIMNKTIYLGCYSDINEAVKIRKEAEIKYNFHKNHGK